MKSLSFVIFMTLLCMSGFAQEKPAFKGDAKNMETKPVIKETNGIKGGDIKDVMSSNKVISLTRGACRGYCPQYTITLHEDGKAVFEGIKNTKMDGTYTKQLSPSMFREVMSNVKNTNLDKFPSEYPSQVVDLSDYTISYFKSKERLKTIHWIDRADEEVVKIAEQLEALTKTKEGWKFCQPEKK